MIFVLCAEHSFTGKRKLKWAKYYWVEFLEIYAPDWQTE